MRALTIERRITWLLIAGVLALLGAQLCSLYVTPIHDSYLWWGDESWLMNEYRSQISTGVFRHPFAYGSSLLLGNPFPFTSMWLTSAIYGTIAWMGSPVHMVDLGRTITAVIAVILLLVFWIRGRDLGLPSISLVFALALLASTRSYLLTSHSARYDILTALAILLLTTHLVNALQRRRVGNYMLLGALWGSGLLVSAHVPLLLLLPIGYFLVVVRTTPSQIVRLCVGVVASIGILYLLHVLLQPALQGETNLSENLRTIPILRPFSWSVQWSNVIQKLDLIVAFAPQIILQLVICVIALFSRMLPVSSKQAIVLLCLTLVGWVFFQPAGPSSYLIHFIPCLALAAAMGVGPLITSNGRRIVIACIAIAFIAFGTKDAIVARTVGETLTQSHLKAIAKVESIVSTDLIVAMNPAQSYLNPPPASTHFIELPDQRAAIRKGEGYLLTYNSSIQPGFMWEVGPLREAVVTPPLTLVGQYLDVGRSYFKPLDERVDTLFLQRLELNELYRRRTR